MATFFLIYELKARLYIFHNLHTRTVDEGITPRSMIALDN